MYKFFLANFLPGPHPAQPILSKFCLGEKCVAFQTSKSPLDQCSKEGMELAGSKTKMVSGASRLT